MLKNSQQDGYIAITSVIIVCLLLVTVITALSSTNYFSRYNILENEYKTRSSALAEACIDQALARLASNSAYAGGETISVGTDSCQIVSVSPGGSFPATIRTQGRFPASAPKPSYTNLLVTVNSALEVQNWQETAN